MNINHSRKPSMFVGDTFASNYYGDMEIVKYINSQEVVVRFPSGEVVNTYAHNIRKGNVRDPSYAATTRGILAGEGILKIVPKTKTMFVGDVYPSNNFGSMEVIEYINAMEVVVKFESGGIVTAQAGQIRSGKVRDPSYRATTTGVLDERGLLKIDQTTNTMDSRDLAELCGVTPSNFNQKLTKVLKEDALKFQSIYLDAYKREKLCYKLPEREACLMAMSYSYELQAKVYDAYAAVKAEHETHKAKSKLDVYDVLAISQDMLKEKQASLSEAQVDYEPMSYWVGGSYKSGIAQRQLYALGLIKPNYSDGIRRGWSLTPEGQAMDIATQTSGSRGMQQQLRYSKSVLGLLDISQLTIH